MPKYEALVDCYGEISGATVFTGVGEEVEGNIPKGRLHHFRLISGGAVAAAKPVVDAATQAEIAGIKAYLDEHGVSYQPNTGIDKLRGYKTKHLADNPPDPEGDDE